MIKNILNTFITKGAVACLSLLILLLSSRELGGAIIGQISLLILNIAIIQIINEIYTGYALVHFIPKFNLKTIYFKGILWTVCCVAIINFIFFYFNIGNLNCAIHTLCLSFILIVHSFNCVIILAKEKIKTYNILMLAQPFILLVALLLSIFYSSNKSVYTYIYALYPAYGIPCIFSFYAIIKLLKNDQPVNETTHITSVFKLGSMNQLGNLAHALSNRFNYYFLGSSIIVGLYANATSLIESVWIIGTSIAPIILTRVANSNEQLAYNKITLLFCKLSFILSLVCVIIIYILPDNLFVFILGKDFSGIKQIMLYLSPGILFISFSIIISHYFSAMGQQRVQLLANTLGLSVTLALSHYLVSRYHIAGACLVASLSYFTQSLVLTIAFMKQHQFNILDLFSIRKDVKLLRELK